MACNLSNRASTAESVTTLRSASQVEGVTPMPLSSILRRTSSSTESCGVSMNATTSGDLVNHKIEYLIQIRMILMCQVAYVLDDFANVNLVVLAGTFADL